MTAGRLSDYNEEIVDHICERRVSIYALTAPGSDEIRYVGKANDAKQRLIGHIHACRYRNTPVYCWIRKLLDQGLIPEMKILEVVPEGQWKSAEIRLIAFYKSPRLLNVDKGGDEPYCSPEVRSEIGKKNAKKYWTKEVRSVNGKRNAKELHADPTRKRWWTLVRSISSDLLRCQDDQSGYSEAHRKKMILNCMAIAELHPKRVPDSWHGLRWDSSKLGELNLETITTYMNPSLLNRIEFV